MTGLAPRVIDPGELHEAALDLLAGGARLAAMTGHDDRDGLRVVATFLAEDGAVTELSVTIGHDEPGIPSLAGLSFPAGQFEREMHDLLGLVPLGHPLPHRLVLHGHWPAGYHPLRHEVPDTLEFGRDSESFPFAPVAGDGVYEIPVGPVHAGLIEPGHFRFFVVGETILQMKPRLYYVHRGVEKLFEGRAVEDGVELAERISGDTAVGHALAYCQAVEQALGVEVGERDRDVRAMLLELERLYNHVNDIGAIINDVGYGIVQAHTAVLREKLMRHHREVTGHRLLRGGVHVGGARLLTGPDVALVTAVAAELAEVVAVALGNHVVMDRLAGTSVLSRSQALGLGVLGYVAKASGISADVRSARSLGVPFTPVVETGGDVLARFQVRAREAQQSAELVAVLAGRLTGDGGSDGDGGVSASTGVGAASAGLGVVEAWRGTLVHRVEVAGGRLTRCKVVDPSFLNWPALPVALKDTIVPDFPLTNKSFNQSYAGNDL